MKKLIFSETLPKFLICCTFLFCTIPSISQPPCVTDVDRNFSVQNAIRCLDQYVRTTDRLVQRDLLLTAYTNLEQVMNYGALKFNKCISCNPYLSIDGRPDHSYMSVARRLVQFGGNEFGGVVETMENRFQTDKYCGQLANETDNLSNIAGNYEFGRSAPVKQVICGGPGNPNQALVLTLNRGNLGREIIICNGSWNEKFYWYINNEIILVDGNGNISSVLYGGPEFWEGGFKLNPEARIAHYLYKIKDPCSRPSWVVNNLPLPPKTCTMHNPPYGASDWITDGDKVWFSGGWKYFIVSGASVIEYDRCGKYIVTHVRDKIGRNENGKTVWSGYDTDMAGNRTGGGWFLVWE